MTSRIAKRISPLIAAICIAFCGCDGGYDCSIENTAYNRIGFYNIDSNNLESKYEFPGVLTISMVINGRDSIVVNRIYGTSDLKLPVSYANECDTLTFNYENGAKDTLFVKHENIPYFVSMECGTAMYHRILSVEHTNAYIDSAAIVNDYIDYDYDENIKLYLVQ